ncbi:MAG: M23 family metallopeptidase [Spirochaetales bacterium]|nr:M23 family metallopeptidase [Spirochaetales bacterium]HNQ96935.1 M23 family metallopeptidase [Treponemataceae bacterium]
MDVISVVQPENNVVRKKILHGSGFTPIKPPFFGEISSASVSSRSMSLSALGSWPVISSFPFLFCALAAMLVLVAPVIQDRVGLYRLGSIDLPVDSGLELSFKPEIYRTDPADHAAIATDESIPLSIQPVSYSDYRVRPGDSVSRILSRTNLQNIGTILAVNNIQNARRIHAGQVLRIPSMDGIIHTVIRGESLERIAKRYSLTVTALLDANDLASETLTKGQALFIPGASLKIHDLRRAMGELFVMPVRGRLTSRYGYRKDPFTGVRSFHTGIDLAAPTGTSVKATLDGRVATTGYSPVYGNYIILSHDGGYQSLYGHLSAISTRRGQYIQQGIVIGKVGNTGYSTGSHLHFSVYKGGKTVDPQTLLK